MAKPRRTSREAEHSASDRKTQARSARSGQNDEDLRLEEPESRLDLPADSKVTERDYRIAELAWRDGLSVGAILDRLGEKHGAKEITSVRRSLQKAVHWGVLKLAPPRHEQLEDELCKRYRCLDRDGIHIEVNRTATLCRAAQLVLEEVEGFLRGEADRFICANAGGRTIAGLVSWLPRFTPIPPKAKDKTIRFVSLNAAEQQDTYGQCANYLCVRMAEIFDAEHMAVVPRTVPERPKDYENAVNHADLIVTAAGGPHGFLMNWLRRQSQQGEPLPDNVMGDIAFHPVDSDGKPVRFNSKLTQALERDLHRSPDWETLQTLFSNKKVLLVLTGDKFEISRALFRAGLPRRCVIDSHLAAQLCRDGTAPPA